MSSEIYYYKREQSFNGIHDFGRKCSVLIPRTHTWKNPRLEITIIDIPKALLHEIHSTVDAYSLIDRVAWTIGGLQVQTYSGDSLRSLGHIVGYRGFGQHLKSSKSLTWKLDIPFHFDETPIDPQLYMFHQLSCTVELISQDKFAQLSRVMEPALCPQIELCYDGTENVSTDEILQNKWLNTPYFFCRPEEPLQIAKDKFSVEFPFKTLHSYNQYLRPDQESICINMDCNYSTMALDSVFLTLEPIWKEKDLPMKDVLKLPIIIHKIKICTGPPPKKGGDSDCMVADDRTKSGSYYSQHLPRQYHGRDSPTNLNPNTYVYNTRRGKNVAHYISTPETYRPSRSHYHQIDHIHISLKRHVLQRFKKKGEFEGFKINIGLFIYQKCAFGGGMGWVDTISPGIIIS